ncbi:phage major capsid protein [Listeria newyorkensis]|uniref:phage major capsid protein n=1 Tax=Listeria newyorkensis TaxID=1497681 RepID=UPI00051DF7C6|nr:phage major capsid protein [Listeria newyorkensis]KGL44119.1 ATPase [Listeria newyorkensis]SQC57679.1 Predicted phage phi-C31 gp36 major capsid-like protein [Listeria newyorkensis]
MKTLFELKQDMLTIGDQLQKTEGELAQKAVDPKVNISELTDIKELKKDLKARFDIIKEQHDSLEAEQKAAMQNKEMRASFSDDPNQKIIEAKAALIRKTIAKESVPVEIFQALGDDDTSKGNAFLPKTVANDILVEPLVKNPLRNVSTITGIPNLEIPKVSFSLDDDEFIGDDETAKELKAKGDTVSFGRHKFKVFTGISETILLGTDTNLVSTVESNLQSGVAAKERKVAFTKNPKPGEEHMSFYDKTKVKIKEVEGIDLYKAIKAAVANLHEDYRENATIFMTYTDYLDIIEKLANGSATLYSAQPEQILGKPVEFTDSAVDPVIGNFAYSHFNYDIAAQFEQDKDIKTGINQFVVTAWLDHQIKLSSAFRIATVKP